MTENVKSYQANGKSVTGFRLARCLKRGDLIVDDKQAYLHIRAIAHQSIFPEIADIYKCALNALKYRIPAEVKVNGEIVSCPSCGYKDITDKYCIKCGQVLSRKPISGV